MQMGTGIFLSAVFLGTVALYIATKDRWNWKKILLWPIVAAAGTAIFGTGGWYLYYTWDQGRPPPPQDEFWGIKLGASQADVRFAKGAPTSILKDDPDFWIYSVKAEDGWEHGVVVRFRNGKVRDVFYHGSPRHPFSIERISSYSSLDDVLARLGEPSSISRSNDDTARIHCYELSRICMEIRAGQIEGLGIFAPEHGPMRYSDEAR